MSSWAVRTLAVATGVSILAACSPPAAPVGPVTVDATLNAAPGSEAAVAGFYVMFDLGLTVTAQASGVISPEPGVYVGPASAVDADGILHLVLPNPADIPSEALGPADGFVWLPVTPSTLCPTTASVPSARVSWTMFGIFESYPMLAVMTTNGFAQNLSTDKKVNFSLSEDQFFDMRFVNWLYADADVDVKTAPGGCANGTDPTVFVDLELKKGWNQVAWSLEEDPATPGILKSMTLGNGADIDPVYFSFTSGGGP